MICNKMKKFFSTLLLMAFMVNMLPSILVFADGPSGKCGENVTYSFNESTGVLTISGNGKMENYEFDDYTPWHEYCESIKSVIIENGVTSIGDSAFAGCANLNSISIPSSIICIGNKALERCEQLTGVNIPNSVFSIGDYALSYCNSLTSITIPGSVTTIGNNSFECCLSLASLIIPGSVTSIGSMAFWGCHDLTSVSFLGNVEPFFGNDVFDGCPKLNKIKVPDNYTNSSFCGKEVEKPYKSFNDNSSFCEEGTEELSSPYFADKSLSNPPFPFCRFGDSEDVNKNLSARATHATYKFNRSTGVLTIFGQGPMPKCEKRNVARWCDDPDLFLRMLNFLTGNKSDLDDHTAYLPPWAPLRGGHVDQDDIKSVVIEEGVTSISAKIFQGCSSLTSVVIPDSVTTIGFDAFDECHNLSSVTIGNGLTSIGSNAFKNCGLTSVTIPDSVTSIGSDAFAGCDKLSSVTIGKGLTSIGSGAFDKCSSLTSINIPNSVTTIGAYAFAECNLTSITIPESVTTIDRQAFNRCYNLLSVGFLGIIAPNAGKNVFNKCSKLKKVLVPNEYTGSSFCGKSIQRLSEDESNCIIA